MSHQLRIWTGHQSDQSFGIHSCLLSRQVLSSESISALAPHPNPAQTKFGSSIWRIVFLFQMVFLALPTLLKAEEAATTSPTGLISVGQYGSLQEAIDANPNRMLYLPAGDHEISDRVVIRTDRSGLYGPGRIIQTNPKAAILQIRNAKDVQLRDLTLSRAEGSEEASAEAIFVHQSEDVVVENVQVIDNRSNAGAISIRESRNVKVRNCLVRNYMRISIDDRTQNLDWGYAFRCIDGTGISVAASRGTVLQGNQVIEKHMLPTPEVKEKYGLGEFIKKNEKKGAIISQETWDREYTSNWHQGSAIIVTSPTQSDYTQIIGNYIENAAQGIDLHSDHVIVSQNIVNNALIGMKAMHGSRHVLIIGNQFSKTDLWSIGIMPGAASYAAAEAEEGNEARKSNSDGGSIIANNIISEFGYGNAHWNWGNASAPIRIDEGQKPDNPPVNAVIIQGNIVYNTGNDEAADENKGPRYNYAIQVDQKATEIHVSNNILHPGQDGISNVELKP